MGEDPQQKKVVNLAEARQRQQTLRPPPKAKGKPPRQGASTGKKAVNTPQARVWVYLQLLVFLAVVAYMMTLCRH